LPQPLRPPAEVAEATEADTEAGTEADMEVDMEVDMQADMEVDMEAGTPTSPAAIFAADISTTAFVASDSGAAGSTPMAAIAAGAGIPASTAT
jgi:hypothetical protein